MPVKDQAKNREYVAKYRAMKKQNEEAKKEYNVLNASYVSKHREVKKAEKGLEEYKKEQAEYMRKYRASLKQTKLQTQTTASTTIQNAIRNKLARNALQNRKQELLNNRSVQGLGNRVLRGLDLGFVFFIYVECTNNTPSIEPDKGSQKHDTFSHEPVTVSLTASWKAIQPQLVKARIQAPSLLPTSLRRTKDV